MHMVMTHYNNPLFFTGFMVLVFLALPLCGRADVGVVVGSTPSSFEERHRESYLLGKRLSPEEVDTLLGFLLRAAKTDGTGGAELATLKNNVADALLQQEVLPPRLFDTFTKGFADHRQGEVWREYIVQKLPELALRLSGAPQKKVLAFLRERTKDTDSIFAGTALIGLDRLHSAKPDLV